ncbi:hypothetical protein EPI10_000553 [Gossypium australe]|uniref:DUF4283 domain-containing protein n=1 Tax=Gossypium australe TaxID=47621 RepID=A0A5B6V8E2_9ROSI|nr:hypothetical protein EPI10_000553 [Gossypium australe]
MLRIEGLKDEVVVESELEIGKDDYTNSTKGKYPEITFFEQIHEWIDRSLAKTVLVRLFGKKKCWLQSFGWLSTSFMEFNWEIPGKLSFEKGESYPSKMVVWLRFPRLPYRYYIKGLLRIVSKVLGKTIKSMRACLSFVKSVVAMGTLRRVVQNKKGMRKKWA